ncbi:hypothetical protein L3556_01350 [Candidatus Synechococcus calcipolaris G9]|uniref:Capsule polysaccharide biosynthesis protein n=1 Tax=Candidatus Synechococcus calcipolaris G9 TaxID=1497997 RepID=A0ABT6EWU6_9SYNE|nr:hypothetical protein [Candidatus Synechococcus calcipolaris]MDG2989583.1 hypothetical protein [Candidatus Synechococcus calcipolaris G9]
MIKVLNYLKSIFYPLSSYIFSDTWQKPTRCDVLLVCNDNDRGYVYKNQAYAQILDSFGDCLEKQGFTVQSIVRLPYSKLIGNKAYRNPIEFPWIEEIYASAKFRSRLLKFIHKPITKRKIINNWIETQLVNSWKNILLQSNAKIVIGIQPTTYICKACHDRKILVYDLQHGMIDPDEIFIQALGYYNKNYKDLTILESSPHGFLCWDQKTASNLRKKIDHDVISTYSIGHPWLNRFLRNDPADQLVQEARKQWRCLKNDKPKILVSLQWGMKENYSQYVPNFVMPLALEDVILAEGDKYHWLVRLHPVQIRGDEISYVLNYLEQTFGKNRTIEWDVPSNAPLPIVLEWSDLHITFDSSTTIEAAMMGVKTGLLSPEIGSYYSYEREIGMATHLLLDSLIIQEWIMSKIESKKHQKKLNDVDKLNYNDSELDNFIKFIKSIIYE